MVIPTPQTLKKTLPQRVISVDSDTDIAPKFGRPYNADSASQSTSGAGRGSASGTGEDDFSAHNGTSTSSHSSRTSTDRYTSQGDIDWLRKLQDEVKDKPHVLVKEHLPTDHTEHVTTMQEYATKASDQRRPLHDAPGFDKQPDGITYKITGDHNLDGPIFMTRVNKEGQKIIVNGKPVYDVLHYDNGRLNKSKSFIAPDGVPEGSIPTVDNETRAAIVQHHHEAHIENTKKQAEALVKKTGEHSTYPPSSTQTNIARAQHPRAKPVTGWGK